LLEPYEIKVSCTFLRGGITYLNTFLLGPFSNKPGFIRPIPIIGRGLCSFRSRWLQPLKGFLSRWYDQCLEREVSTGGQAIQEELRKLNLFEIIGFANHKWEQIVHKSEQMWTWNQNGENYVSDLDQRAIQWTKDAFLRRIKLIKDLLKTSIHPEWMVFSVLPVLSAELRPIMELRNGQLITSDLNELYLRVLVRNNQVLDTSSPWKILDPDWIPTNLCGRFEKVLLQESIDALLDNGMGAPPFRDSNKRIYKSFSDVIKGKKGRFRQNLLGKRVDYSGRSVIVVAPSLALHQCGLPVDMAIELFQPFVIHKLIAQGLAPNLKAAKLMIHNKEVIVCKVLQTILENHPILLNRAPTLHRLGIQAFEPVLTYSSAIHLHPLVCSGFNADFDGDQMAVHVPISTEAQTEARILMQSQNCLLSPATGRALAVPSQDMLLGLYLLTLEGFLGIYANRRLYHKKISHNLISKIPIFLNYEDTMMAANNRYISIHSPIWLLWKNQPILTVMVSEKPIEIQYEATGNHFMIYDHMKIYTNKKNHTIRSYMLTTAGRVIFNQQIEQAFLQEICLLNSCNITSQINLVTQNVNKSSNITHKKNINYTPFPPVSPLDEMWLT
jgi:DNA-directed RNA polymerase subunit beta'